MVGQSDCAHHALLAGHVLRRDDGRAAAVLDWTDLPALRRLVFQTAGYVLRHYRRRAPRLMEPRIFLNLAQRSGHGENPAPLGRSLYRLALLCGLNGQSPA